MFLNYRTPFTIRVQDLVKGPRILANNTENQTYGIFTPARAKHLSETKRIKWAKEVRRDGSTLLIRIIRTVSKPHKGVASIYTFFNQIYIRTLRYKNSNNNQTVTVTIDKSISGGI